MNHFVITVIAGAIFGAGAGLLLLHNGRIAGVSGITAGIVDPERGDVAWRVLFIAGLCAGGAVGSLVFPGAIAREHGGSVLGLIAAGLCVGAGARIGNGCTSGHGVCGVGRFSMRSIVACGIFTLSGAIAYALRMHFGGGAS